MALIANTQSLSVRVAETSDVGEARRRGVAAARDHGFDEGALSNLGIAITEAANNVVRHGTGGEIVFRLLERGGARGIELLALDKGPGMAEVERCLKDGFSTGSTPGTGMGAMRRLATEFDVHSVMGLGTAILARFWKDGVQPRARGCDVGAVCIAIRGENECGDAWAFDDAADNFAILVADGLGHGPLAAEASLRAAHVFSESARKNPIGVLDSAHLALNGTRGAAVAVVSLDWSSHGARFAGVGNIAGFLFAGGKRHGLASANGIVGHEVRKLQEFSYPAADFRAVILHSDGLTTRWNLDDPKYAGLLTRDPALIAGILYRDFSRGRDDATCVVMRCVRG